MAFAQVIIIMSIEIIYCYFVQTIYFKPEYMNQILVTNQCIFDAVSRHIV